MTGWRKRQVVDMAREAGFEQVGHDSFQEFTARIERFEALVRADERGRMCEQLKECLNEKSTSHEANRSAVLGEGG